MQGWYFERFDKFKMAAKKTLKIENDIKLHFTIKS